MEAEGPAEGQQARQDGAAQRQQQQQQQQERGQVVDEHRQRIRELAQAAEERWPMRVCAQGGQNRDGVACA